MIGWAGASGRLRKGDRLCGCGFGGGGYAMLAALTAIEALRPAAVPLRSSL